MSNFGITQNFRAASINRKLSRTPITQKEEEENIFEQASTFVLKISKDGTLSNDKESVSTDVEKESVSTSVEKTASNKLNLYATKTNRTVIKSADHH